jgi:PAS domain S-box-containing protein
MEQDTIRILVVSPDGTAVWLISQTLVDDGFAVETSPTQAEALARLKDEAYDLIIVEPEGIPADRIPILDSAVQGRAPVPVIIVTTYDRVRVAIDLLREYPGDYLTKDPEGKYIELMPYVVDKTLERHRLLLERSQNENDLKRIADEKLAILNSMSEMVLYLDEEKNVLWANNSITASIGTSQRELSGHRCYEILMKRARPCESCPLPRVRETRLPQMAEISGDNGTIWSIAMYPEMDEEGTIKGVVEVKQDITERRRWEQKLKEASDEWRSTFDSIIDIIAINDIHFRFIKVNKAFADLFGLQPKEIVGKTCHELLYGYPDPCPDCPQMAAYGADSPARLEYFERRFGDDIEVTASPIVSGDNQVIGLVTIGKDISQQARWQETLLRASTEWRTTFDSIVDPISIIDNDFRIIKSNRAFADMAGKEPKQLIGKICYEVLHSRDNPCEHCPQPVSKETGTTALTEYFDEGRTRFLQVSSSPIVGDGGAIVGFVNVKNDITGQMKERDDLKKYSGHLKKMVGQLSKELQDTQGRILEKSHEKARKQIAGKLALEIKRPLSTVTAALRSIKGPHAESPHIKDAQRVVARLEQVTANLLAYSHERAPKREEIVVSELIARVLEKNLPPDSINLTLNIPFDIPYVFVDPKQIEHALVNLIANAVESMPQGGDLTVKAQRKGAGVSVSISDSGHGIPAKTMERVFEPLFTTRQSAVGLGLSVAKDLIEASGGSLALESDNQNGVTAVVFLPTSERAGNADGVEELFTKA